MLEGEDADTALARGHGAPRRARRSAGRARRRPRASPRWTGAALLADARPRAGAPEEEPAARRRHHALGAPGRRPLRHADRADRRGPGAAAATAAATARSGRLEVEELPSGEVEIEGDEELAEEEPLDWDAAEEAEEEAAAEAALEDPGADRRFWFEHATGAGKTVAALGFVEASRTGGVLILTHRRNLVDQFNGELRDRGYKKRIAAPLLQRQGRAAGRRPGHRRDLPVVRAQRRQDLRRLHDRHLRRGPHRARREDERRDPPVDRARCSSA